jgi:hypothetical protein
MIEKPTQWSKPEREPVPPPPAPPERKPQVADPLADLAQDFSQPSPALRQPTEAELNSSADQNLVELMQRLEAALHRPVKGDDRRAAEGTTRAMPTPKPAPRKSIYDSVEQQMTSLLDQPADKMVAEHRAASLPAPSEVDAPSRRDRSRN